MKRDGSSPAFTPDIMKVMHVLSKSITALACIPCAVRDVELRTVHVSAGERSVGCAWTIPSRLLVSS